MLHIDGNMSISTFVLLQRVWTGESFRGNLRVLCEIIVFTLSELYTYALWPGNSVSLYAK